MTVTTCTADSETNPRLGAQSEPEPSARHSSAAQLSSPLFRSLRLGRFKPPKRCRTAQRTFACTRTARVGACCSLCCASGLPEPRTCRDKLCPSPSQLTQSFRIPSTRKGPHLPGASGLGSGRATLRLGGQARSKPSHSRVGSMGRAPPVPRGRRAGAAPAPGQVARCRPGTARRLLTRFFFCSVVRDRCSTGWSVLQIRAQTILL